MNNVFTGDFLFLILLPIRSCEASSEHYVALFYIFHLSILLHPTLLIMSLKRSNGLLTSFSGVSFVAAVLISPS